MRQRANGHILASLNPRFQVFLPSRFHDPAIGNSVGLPIAACCEVETNGNRARGGACERSSANGTLLDVTWGDPRSRFNGVRGKVGINSNRISNLDGPNCWYTDPFGRIARVNNDRAFNSNGPTIGGDRAYGAATSLAPNQGSAEPGHPGAVDAIEAQVEEEAGAQQPGPRGEQ